MREYRTQSQSRTSKGRVIKLPEVMRKTGLSRSSIYEYIRQRRFPAQIKLGGPRAVGWLEHEVDECVANWVNERRV
ncbi:AlpA family phage regulatory protein [Desulfosediminicola sp.]|uniref:AlpA family phage regulatory protein n=1 Tax=Desulfosediminicola sp. TaxID=2886825 RepID=UPI003AF2CD03